MQSDELVRENARLQAEVERLRGGALQQVCDHLNEKVEALQSELTKARELLSTHCPNISIGVREFLSNQSAPVDKGQGEPVAWHTDDHLTDKSSTTYDHTTMERWRAKGWPVTPLYAAQPAPVAVVMPDFDTWYVKNRGVIGTAIYKNERKVWNACLDEFARLNPIKQ